MCQNKAAMSQRKAYFSFAPMAQYFLLGSCVFSNGALKVPFNPVIKWLILLVFKEYSYRSQLYGVDSGL